MCDLGRVEGVAQVKQITDEEGFMRDCLGVEGDSALDLPPAPHKQLCFLAFLPDILDSKVLFLPHWVLSRLSRSSLGRPLAAVGIMGRRALQQGACPPPLSPLALVRSLAVVGIM